MRGCRSYLAVISLALILVLGLGTNVFGGQATLLRSESVYKLLLQVSVHMREKWLGIVYRLSQTKSTGKAEFLGGRKVEIVVGDDQFSPKQSALVAQRMISEKVVAVIGTYGSSVTEPAATIYEREGLLNIAYGSTAVQLTEHGWQYFFRTCFRDDHQGTFFGRFVNETLKMQNVAIIHDNTTFGKGGLQRLPVLLWKKRIKPELCSMTP